MSDRPLIEMVCDGSRAQGYGHLRRSSALAWQLVARGYRVRVHPLSQVAADALPEVPREAGEADLFVVDLPYASDDRVALARERGKPVITLDYIGTTLLPDLDISIWDRDCVPAATPRKIGLQYAIIREEITRRCPASAGGGVMVMIGGGDPCGLGPTVAERLAGWGEQVTLVEGPLAPACPDFVVKGYVRLHVPDDLPERMATCGWAVTNGGTTLMEMMCLGKAVHVIPQTDAEYRMTAPIVPQGGVLGLGLETLLAVPSPAAATEVGMRARTLVDGLGMQRIADEVAAWL